MKITVEKFADNTGIDMLVELDALDALVDAFAAKMKRKLKIKALENGYTGWDNPDFWSKEDARFAMMVHVEKGDPVDVANFAAFLWNMQDNQAEEGDD